MKLVEHRTKINSNTNAYSEDLKGDRLVKSMIPHIKKDFHAIKFTQKKREILKEIIDLIFETQDRRPFFHVEGTELPLCWNRPADWNIDHIKYEWGHLLSKNQAPEGYNSIENVGLYSARCNQHLQSSMNIQELMVYGGLLAQRISNVLINRRALFESEKWKDIKMSLND